MEDRQLLSGPTAGLGLVSTARALVDNLLPSSPVTSVGPGLPPSARAAVAPTVQHVNTSATQTAESLTDSKPVGPAAGQLSQVDGLVDDVIPGVAQVGTVLQGVSPVVSSLATQGLSVADHDQGESQTGNSSPAHASTSGSGPDAALTGGSGPVVALIGGAGPVVALIGNSSPAAALTGSSTPAAVLTGNTGPAAALTGSSGPVVALIVNSGPAAALTGGSSPGGAPPASRNDGVQGPLGNISLTAHTDSAPVPGVAQVNTADQGSGASGAGVNQGVVQSGNANQEVSTPIGIEGPPSAASTVQGPPSAPAGDSSQAAEPSGDVNQSSVPASGLAPGGSPAAGPNQASTLIGAIPPAAPVEMLAPNDAVAAPISRDVTPSGPGRSRGQGVDVDSVGAWAASPHDVDRVIDPALGIEGILADTLPIDLVALDRAIEHCLNGLGATGDAWAELLGSDEAWPWLTFALVAATAFLMAERWRQKTQYRPVAPAGDDAAISSWLFESALRG